MKKRPSTYEYFGNVTGLGDVAPTPFRVGAVVGELGHDEIDLFEEMVPSYKRNAGEAARWSFVKFRTAWNVRVRTERAKVDGGLQLTTKDLSMLQKYYDEVYTKAAEKADDGKYNDQQRLHYQNLKEMVDAPEANQVAPRPFASPGGPAQFAGAALKPQIAADSRMAAAAVQARPYEESAMARAAPFAVRAGPQKATAAAPPVAAAKEVKRRPPGGGWRAFCSSCGDAKAAHSSKGERIGPKCKRPCVECGVEQAAHVGCCGHFCTAAAAAGGDVQAAVDTDGDAEMEGMDV